MMNESVRRTGESIYELSVHPLLEAKESSVEIIFDFLEDMMRLPRVVLLNISLPVI